MNWIGQSTQQLLDALQRKEVTAVELTEEHLNHIAAHDSRVGGFLEVFAERARQSAAEVDRKRAAGVALGALAGIPVAIKDNMNLTGEVSSCASRILEKYRAPYDAHICSRLKQADAVLIGRTNMDEFAMGSSCESSAYQKTYNPWNLKHSPGGSSGGSAAVVAAGMAPIAIGSDTGGSIRQPGSFCGVVGLKPTYGRVSRYGLIAFASSLDQIGPLTTTVHDAALTLEVLAGHDTRDSTSANVPAADYAAHVDLPLEKLRIGIVREHFGAGLHDEVRQVTEAAIETYQRLGATIVDVELPNAKYGVAVYYILAPSEASSNLARFDGVHYGHRASGPEKLSMIAMYERSRGEGFGAEVKRRIMLGTYALSSGYYDAYYKKALQVRRLIRDDYSKAFQQVDFILTPAAPSPPFEVGELSNDPLAMYLNDLFTIGANLAGLPGISVPAGMTKSGLPIGVQLLGPAFEEDRLLRCARMLEREVDQSAARAQCLQRLTGN